MEKKGVGKEGEKEDISKEIKNIVKIDGQECPVCHKNTLILTQIEREIPNFGRAILMSMSCQNCLYHSSDVELLENKGRVKYELDIESPEDLNVIVIRSSTGKIKVPGIGSIEPRVGNGFITTVEGVLLRLKKSVELLIGDEGVDQKKAKRVLKKINRLISGWDKGKIILEDPKGNSAIVSKKAKLK